jgi:hypothetical protein
MANYDVGVGMSVQDFPIANDIWKNTATGQTVKVVEVYTDGYVKVMQDGQERLINFDRFGTVYQLVK